MELTADNGLIVVGTTNTETHFLAAWLLRLDANGNTVWQRSYGGIDGNDNGRAVLPTRDGGYVLAGRTDSFGAGDGDAWLLGLDANGNVICQRSYGGTDIDVFESLTLTDDGGYVVAGGTRSFGAGGFYVWVLKVNAVGDISNCNIIATSNVAPVDIVGNLGDRFATARATSADTKRRGGHRSVDRSDR